MTKDELIAALQALPGNPKVNIRGWKDDVGIEKLIRGRTRGDVYLVPQILASDLKLGLIEVKADDPFHRFHRELCEEAAQ